jgi:hypothetical protein
MTDMRGTFAGDASNAGAPAQGLPHAVWAVETATAQSLPPSRRGSYDARRRLVSL